MAKITSRRLYPPEPNPDAPPFPTIPEEVKARAREVRWLTLDLFQWLFNLTSGAVLEEIAEGHLFPHMHEDVVTSGFDTELGWWPDTIAWELPIFQYGLVGPSVMKAWLATRSPIATEALAFIEGPAPDDRQRRAYAELNSPDTFDVPLGQSGERGWARVETFTPEEIAAQLHFRLVNRPA